MKGSRNTSGFILLDMLVSLPILVFLLAAMGPWQSWPSALPFS